MSSMKQSIKDTINEAVNDMMNTIEDKIVEDTTDKDAQEILWYEAMLRVKRKIAHYIKDN